MYVVNRKRKYQSDKNDFDDADFVYPYEYRPAHVDGHMTHEVAEDGQFHDSMEVINVEDADKLRRPHLYLTDPITNSLLRKNQWTVHIVAITSAILFTILGLCGLACVARRMKYRGRLLP